MQGKMIKFSDHERAEAAMIVFKNKIYLKSYNTIVASVDIDGGLFALVLRL